jgi:cytochrome c553
MKTVLALTLIICSTTAHSAELILGDASKGKQLHSQDCVACHDSSVYTRPDRIKSLSGLEQRVQMCSTMLNKGYTEDDQANIVRYLNDTHYKF